MKNTTAYLTSLTPLRSIVALLVVLFHPNLMLAPFVNPQKTNFGQSGWLWPGRRAYRLTLITHLIRN